MQAPADARANALTQNTRTTTTTEPPMRMIRILAVLVFFGATAAGCGSKDEATSSGTPPAAASGPALAPSEPAASAPDAAPVATESESTAASPASDADDPRAQTAAFMEAMQAAARLNQDPNATPEQKAAAREKMMEAASKMQRPTRNVRQQELVLPPDWAQTHRVVKGANEAELLVQVGDIDNLGFGWPTQFDPFSGESTPIHRFPWAPEADDPPGTDRIMVNSGMIEKRKARRNDGYSNRTKREDTAPQPLSIHFDPKGAPPIKAAVLQLFVDDLQAPMMKTRFSVKLDGAPAPDLENTINELNQTGPVGKLVTVQLLPEYLSLLADGKLEIFIDDATTNAGDGFAFDFARLLINPKGYAYAGVIRGLVVDKADRKPVAGALVSAANVRQATTPADGRFELRDVPAGLVVTTASHTDYITGSQQKDLLADQTVDVVIELERAKNEDLAERLEEDGKVDLYGIYFDTDKDMLKPQSEATLQQVLAILKSKPSLSIAIAGHTDSQASDAYNVDLSRRRAQAVVGWLRLKGIDEARLTAQGFGESQPVADNASEAGRALNRRVEVRDRSR
jgi:outer membrane protein OmpA-like peptidoglycan-associated protein